MNIGDEIILTETVLVIDDIGHDFLIMGTVGSITGVEVNLLSVRTTKGVYDNISAASVKIRTEEKAA